MSRSPPGILSTPGKAKNTTKNSSEIPKQIYLPPEKRQRIVYGFRLIQYINRIDYQKWVTFTTDILNEKLYFLCSDSTKKIRFKTTLSNSGLCS